MAAEFIFLGCLGVYYIGGLCFFFCDYCREQYEEYKLKKRNYQRITLELPNNIRDFEIQRVNGVVHGTTRNKLKMKNRLFIPLGSNGIIESYHCFLQYNQFLPIMPITSHPRIR